jgi:hypothetical protein
VTRDWFDMIEALLAQGARFLVVGAHAMAVHGVPRGTQDLDLWVDPTPSNAERVWRALEVFRAPTDALELDTSDFTEQNTVIQLGLPPNRIDFLTSLTGLADFESAWSSREEHPVRGVSVPFLGREALVANKRATGRLKDQADLLQIISP